MPIYEYVCDECEESFETLVTKGEDVTCPKCHASSLSRQYSRFGFASSSGKGESLPLYNGGGGCGCTPATCGCKNN